MTNLTPHNICVDIMGYESPGAPLTTLNTITIPPFIGGPARVITTEVPAPNEHGYAVMHVDDPAGIEGGPIPLVRRVMGRVEMPPGVPTEGALIVNTMVLDAMSRDIASDQFNARCLDGTPGMADEMSALLADAAKGRKLLARMVVPDSGPTARREKGLVVAVKRFVVA